MTRGTFPRSQRRILALTLGTILVILAIVGPIGLRVQASESSVIIRPNADFVVAQWTDGTDGCQTDATRFDALVEDPHDGNTTCRATGTAGDNWQLSFEDPGSPAGVLDIDVFVSLTGRVTGGQTIRWSVVAAPPCELEAESNVPADIVSAAYTTETALLEYCATTMAVVAVEWTEARVNALRLDVDCVPTGAGLCFVTQAYAEVRYTIQDEPGAPPPEPPPPLPEQIQQAAVGVAKEFCNLWLLLLLAAAIAVAYVARRMKRSGEPT